MPHVCDVQWNNQRTTSPLKSPCYIKLLTVRVQCMLAKMNDSILLLLPPPSLLPPPLPFSIRPSQDEPDPFYDLEQHALLGVANIYVEALHHDVRHEYDAPIIAPTGKVRREHV